MGSLTTAWNAMANLVPAAMNQALGDLQMAPTGTAGGYLESMTSFSGADIRAVLGGVEIGEIQQVSWSVVREKGGNFVLGDENARSFSRGRRFIAGAMMFGFFSREALMEGMKGAMAAGHAMISAYQYFEWRDKGPNLAANLSGAGTAGELLQAGVPNVQYLDPRAPDLSSDSTAVADQIRVSQEKNLPRGLATVRYADQILPFNITIVAANEYGVSARMAILGVEIVNSESGVAIETMQMDHRYTFLAREVIPWQKSVTPSRIQV